MRMWITWLGVLCLAACSSTPPVFTPRTADDARAVHRIHVVNHGWHTGVVVAANAVKRALPFVHRDIAGAAYYEFGWGDKAFYQAPKMTFGLALQAILWPSESVVHVVGLEQPPDRHYRRGRLVRLQRSTAQLQSLLLFLEASFRFTDEGRALANGPGLVPNSRFYAGAGTYNLFNTCNTWTAKALNSAGVDIVPGGIITAGALMSALKAATRPHEAQ